MLARRAAERHGAELAPHAGAVEPKQVGSRRRKLEGRADRAAQGGSSEWRHLDGGSARLASQAGEPRETEAPGQSATFSRGNLLYFEVERRIKVRTAEPRLHGHAAARPLAEGHVDKPLLRTRGDLDLDRVPLGQSRKACGSSSQPLVEALEGPGALCGLGRRQCRAAEPAAEALDGDVHVAHGRLGVDEAGGVRRAPRGLHGTAWARR
mmetsp:Transcript_105101/g.279681  ORF Transcript_105101/g.279681 Transcript_105101/m.279681 type:complete len:209 (-) Transcript_105101:15-641(-)